MECGADRGRRITLLGAIARSNGESELQDKTRHNMFRRSVGMCTSYFNHTSADETNLEGLI